MDMPLRSGNGDGRQWEASWDAGLWAFWRGACDSNARHVETPAERQAAEGQAVAGPAAAAAAAAAAWLTLAGRVGVGVLQAAHGVAHGAIKRGAGQAGGLVRG